MPKVEIYTTNTCPYCKHAKALFEGKGVSYEEINVTGDDDARIALVRKANGMRTVPQIFINDQHVGGYDDAAALDQAGKLDEMLAR